MKDTERLRGRAVLIVEDDATIAFFLREMGLEYGYEVAGVLADVPSALAAARDVRFDVAVLDVNVSGRQTWPVAEAVQARGLPFLFMTGADADSMPLSWSHVPRLLKPFRHADLVAGLARALATAAN